MERIAWKIADKVSEEIHIQTILHKSPEHAKKLIEEAKTVLDAWHNTYMDVRQKIEESGSDHRWQFDRKRLFEQTNYMSKVCSDLVEVRLDEKTLLPLQAPASDPFLYLILVYI